jgi:DNA ligase (NAD+)
LQAVPDVGAVVARSLRTFLDEPTNAQLVDDLERSGVTMAEAPSSAGGRIHRPLAGKTFVLTGTLPGMTREAASEAIVNLGGRVSSAVSGKTSYVVIGNDPGSKADKARTLGIPELDEEALRALIMDNQARE